jgi:hypothetical protein
VGLFSGMRRRATETVSARLGGEVPLMVDDGANYFGRDRRGKAQMRGNGCLMLTDHHLGFVMWWPQRELIVERSAIVAVDTARSHLGKTIARELLRVAWEDEEGPDRAAWYVRDLPAWLAALGGPPA